MTSLLYRHGFESAPESSGENLPNEATPEISPNDPSSTEALSSEIEMGLDTSEDWGQELVTMIENEGLSPEETRGLLASLPAFFENISPEAMDYIQNLSPELESVSQKVAQARESGQIEEATNLLVEFLEQQEEALKVLPDETMREEILGMIGSTLHVQEAEVAIGTHSKLELLSAGIDIIPVIGSAKMLTESAVGKTMSGKHLEGKDRASHAAWGASFAALDAVAVGGVFVGGAPSAAAEGAKITARGASVAKTGLQVGRTITRTAALCRKVGKAGKTTKTVRTLFRVGSVMKKYPRVAGSIIKLVEKKRTVKKLNTLRKDTGDLATRAHKFVPKGLDDLPEAA